jgi:hypothetical protein
MTVSGSRFPARRLALITAASAVAILLAALPAGASAFAISGLGFDPSTTQAAAHPDTTLSLSLSGSPDEDIRDLTVDLPPGLIGNPEAVAKCTRAQFRADACPASSRVGTTTAVAAAIGLSLPPVDGSVYVLEPDPTDAGTLGIVLRPLLSGLVVSKLFIVNHIVAARTADGTDYLLRNVITNMPRQITLLGGLLPINVGVQLKQMTLVLKRQGATPGSFFLTNPTSCKPAVTRANAVSYDGQASSAQASFTPTNCQAVPFDPTLDLRVDSTRINSPFLPTATIGLPASEDPLHQSHVKDVTTKFPPGVGLDFIAATVWARCSDADFQNDACPPKTRVGSAEVAVPPLAPGFTGDVYRVTTKPGSIFSIGAVLRGPRGVKALVQGSSWFTYVMTPSGPQIQVIVAFTDLPQIPFTRFALSLTAPILINPGICQTRDAQVTLVGHSGATATVSQPYTTTGC